MEETAEPCRARPSLSKRAEKPGPTILEG